MPRLRAVLAAPGTFIVDKGHSMFFITKLRMTAVLCCLSILSTLSMALGVIDFETIPGGTPSDGLAIATQFAASHGVTFSLENGQFPVLAQVGAPLTAFEGPGAAADTPRQGVDLGQFFMTDDGMLNGIPSPLIAAYVTPVAAASGDIIDIDFSEAWSVQVLGASGFIVEEIQLTPQPGADGSRSSWSFMRAQAGIFAIRIAFTGTPVGGGNVGLAFDNFSTSTVGSTVGQANSSDASLIINNIGSGGGAGPFFLSVGSAATITLEWQGPPLSPLSLFTGPTNIGSISGPCFGSVDLGTAPYFFDILVVWDGSLPGPGLFFQTNTAGNVRQTVVLPTLPVGFSFGLQGLIYQGGGGGCAGITTAAFELTVN